MQYVENNRSFLRSDDLPKKLANILGAHSADVWRRVDKWGKDDTRADVVLVSASRRVVIGVYFDYHGVHGKVSTREHYGPIATSTALRLAATSTFLLVAKNVVFK